MGEPNNFSVVRRNYGHWDICTKEDGRAFAIRGGPGRYYLRDERQDGSPRPRATTAFKTLGACMTFVCDVLMYELIVADGQQPVVIESWNVGGL